MSDRVKSYIDGIVIAVIGGLFVILIAAFFFEEKPTTVINNSSNKIIQPDVVSHSNDPIIIEPGKDLNKGDQPLTAINDPTVNVKATDLSRFINPRPFIANGISILIIDEEGKNLSSVASGIAEIYSQKGRSSNIGLFKAEFILTPEFKSLLEGNSSIIERVKLSSFTDYVCIGQIKYSFVNGTLVEGTVVCSISLNITIISAKEMNLITSFPIEGKGNGVSKAQAQEYALNDLFNKYSKHIDEHTF